MNTKELDELVESPEVQAFTDEVDAEIFAEENPECPVCGGPGLPLGQLGNRMHFSCQNCGMQFSQEVL